MKTKLDWKIDVLAGWVALAGIYPLADPGHALHSSLSIIDVTAHFVAGAILVIRLSFRAGLSKRG